MTRIDHPFLKGVLFGSVALLAMGVLAYPPLASAAENVKVCHREPGNPAQCRLITIPQAAVAAHIAHGDARVVEEDGREEAIERLCEAVEVLYREVMALPDRERARQFCFCDVDMGDAEWPVLCIGNCSGVP